MLSSLITSYVRLRFSHTAVQSAIIQSQMYPLASYVVLTLQCFLFTIKLGNPPGRHPLPASIAHQETKACPDTPRQNVQSQTHTQHHWWNSSIVSPTLKQQIQNWSHRSHGTKAVLHWETERVIGSTDTYAPSSGTRSTAMWYNAELVGHFNNSNKWFCSLKVCLCVK
jgi:hypothetical protein